MRSISPLVFVAIILFISGCGGGGGESVDNSRSPVQTNPAPPSPNSLWSPLMPTYTGSTDDFVFTKGNTSESSLSIVYLLDFLTSFTLEDPNPLIFLVEQADENTSALNESPECEAGTITADNDPQRLRSEILYDNCTISSLRLNGSLRAFATGPDSNPEAETTVNVDLELTDLESGESISLFGHFVREISFDTTFQMLITGFNNEQLYVDGLTLDAPENSAFTHFKYSGDIYFSDSGKISIDTTSFSRDEPDRQLLAIELKGENTVYIDAIMQVSMLLSLENVSETISIPLTIDFALPESQIAPVAVASAGDNVEYGEILRLSGIESSDANYEFLDYQWSIASQVVGANVQIENASSSEATVTTDLPGDYDLLLTVTDASGLADSIILPIRMLQQPPRGELIFTQTVFAIGDSIQAQMQVNNPTYDGPFDYAMQYGPSNMMINGRGEISWDGIVPNFGHDLVVNLSVRVANQDHEVVFPTSITMQPVSAPLVMPFFPTWFSGQGTQENNGRYIDFNNFVKQEYELSNGEFNAIPSRKPDSIIAEDMNFYAAYDYNNDGINDYFFLRETDIPQRFELFYSNELDVEKKLITEVSINNDSRFSTIQLRFFDLSKDGLDDVVIYTDTMDRIVEIETGNVLFDASSWDFPEFRGKISVKGTICDLNDDGFNELLTDSSTAEYADFSSPAYNRQSLSLERNAQTELLSDQNGAPSCKIAVDKSRSGTNDPKGQIFIYDIETGEQELLVDIAPFFVNAPYIGEISIRSVNIDDDLESELLIGVDYFDDISEDALLLIDDVLTDTPLPSIVISKANIEPIIPSVTDLTGDGIGELIVTNEAPYSLEVYQKQNDNFVSIATTDLPQVNSIDRFQWLKTGHLNIDNVDVIFDENGIATSSYDDENEENKPFTENGELFWYSIEFDDSGTQFLEKKDSNNERVWRTEQRDEHRQMLPPLMLTDRILLFESFTFDGFITLVDRASGDILYHSEAPEFVLKPQGRYRNDIIRYRDNDQWTVPVLTADDSHTPRMLRFSDNGTDIDVIINNEITEFLSLDDYDFYGFTQVDSDPQAEMVKQLYNQDESPLIYLDMSTFTIEQNESLEIDASAFASFSARSFSTANNCISWALDCRNYILSEEREESFSKVYGLVSKIDRRSGEIIWQSNPFRQTNLAIEIKKVGGKLRYLVNKDDAWLLIE